MRAFLDRLLRAREGSQSRWLLVAALAAFIAFTRLGIRALPHIDKPIRWELILIAGLVCVPVIVVLNAFEFRLMAHFADHHPPMLEILQITVLGSAANLLPMAPPSTPAVPSHASPMIAARFRPLVTRTPALRRLASRTITAWLRSSRPSSGFRPRSGS
jgi:hypothetical protein